MKQILSILLVFSFLAGNLPVWAIAEEATPAAEQTEISAQSAAIPENTAAAVPNDQTRQVEFVLEPADLTLALYKVDEGQKEEVKQNSEKENQNLFTLMPGTYCYTAEREGYLKLTEEPLTVDKAQDTLKVEITLERDPAKTAVSDAAEGTVPETTETAVPAAAEESVPETTEAAVPAAAEESVPETTEAEIPETIEAEIPAVTEETVPETTESLDTENVVL